MKRTFLKVAQFNDTNTCIVGQDFIGNGHWLIHQKYVSNRRRFSTKEDAQDFVNDQTELLFVDETLVERIARSADIELIPSASISDLCIGQGVALEGADDEARFIQATCANLLKQITSSKDQIKGNDEITIALNDNDEIGLAIYNYQMNDLINSNRNRNIVKLLAKQMGILNIS